MLEISVTMSHEVPPVQARWGAMRIRLIRKLADLLDGIDVSQYLEGDVFDLTPREAELLIAEGWAVLMDDWSADGNTDPAAAAREYSSGHGFSESALLEQLRRLHARAQIGSPKTDPRRRAEDLIREKHHDSQAKIVKDDQ